MRVRVREQLCACGAEAAPARRAAAFATRGRAGPRHAPHLRLWLERPKLEARLVALQRCDALLREGLAVHGLGDDARDEARIPGHVL